MHSTTVRKALRRLALGGLLFAEAVFMPVIAAAGPIERRRDQFGKDFSYFLYPVVADIPGLGSAWGAGASVLNMIGTDADFTGFYLDGDFEARGGTLLDLHVIPRRLILDIGYYDFLAAPALYHRGMGSDSSDYVMPKMDGTNIVGQVTWSLWDRMLEIYYRGVATSYNTLQVLDSAGNAYDVNDTSGHDARTHTIGVAADYTDDRLDPRRGVRFEMAGKVPTIDDPLRSSYYTLDYNLTSYIPMRRWDTLVLNIFASDAHVTGAATTDYAELQKSMGLGCDRLEPGAEREQCLATEAKTIDERIAENRYGTASSLGGTQRLRSFSNNRFKAGHAIFYGAEYRWNLTDERVPFDIIIARGVRTSLQVALFAEQGAVYDGSFGDWSDLQASYGAGFRVALSGTILRADYATGSEGSQFQLFINYPWSMFAVDNPE